MTESPEPGSDQEVAAALTEETARQLKRQATSLRRAAADQPSAWRHVRYSIWQKVLVLVILISVLGIATALLASVSLRRTLLGEAVSEWSRLYQTDEQAGLFKLPPPPPKRVQARVVVQQPFIIEADPGSEPTFADQSVAPGPQPHVPPPKTPGAGSAYQLLLSQSPAASKLQSGGLSGLEFREWRPVQNDPPNYLIALVAFSSSEQREVIYTWRVDVQASKVQALSQVARDLEARVAKQGG